jgi:hypothetical protein
MISIKPERYYRIMYSDSSHKNFQAISVPLAKHLITVKIEDGSNLLLSGYTLRELD